ncbi:hypothetical protein FGIG_06760 [Fasciola gigantica]|uniref:14-3-3 domain-containing protein n=1 Tax=Fasciola gigantica TaxID=46835 RepID=A0A504YQA5_FASGI|nr:hypothetical protein FGIG_06760 [Fasciola gigantica]
MSLRKALLRKVKLAEKTKRYEDMIHYLRELKLLDTDYGQEEQNLSAVAYKSLIDPLRSSLKVIQKELSKAEEENSPFLEYDELFASQVKTELQCLIQQAIDELNKNINTWDSDVEADVLCFKLKADYYRYLAELHEGNEKEYLAEYSLIAYKQAQSLAFSSLPSNNSVRLAVALNYATFHYTITKKLDLACQIAQKAYRDAASETEDIHEEQKTDSNLLLQMLKNNASTWTKELQRNPPNQ